MDAITLLKNDHKEVKRLFRDFERAKDDRARKEAVEAMIRELSVHSAIEEQIFYPAVRQEVPDENDTVLEGLEEHHVVKWTLSELEGMEPSDERYKAKVTVLIESVRHHIEEEEGEMFPAVREALGRKRLGEIGDRMELAETEDTLAQQKALQAKLYEAGFAGITWPAEYGGQGLTNRHQMIWAQESGGYELPTIFTIGLGMCGPTVLTHGTEEHKERYIRPMLRGDEVWSQLFSEPGAGSDVASLQTRAIRDGDEWVVNGQKAWTSGAHYSDWGIGLARTDPDQPKHRGISMFILDFKAPGVTVKPLRQMTGGANFNEVFFDDLRIPHDYLLGDVNEGWRCAITTLMNERVAIGAGGGGGRAGGVDSLIRAARRRGLDKDPVMRQRLVDAWTPQA